MCCIVFASELGRVEVGVHLRARQTLEAFLANFLQVRAFFSFFITLKPRDE